MKRGKDDEKILEPLFPRLHVKDADKGGPRAPPRNKMALYEQLSIPSQRFNHQACGPERNLYFHHQVSTSAPSHPVENFVMKKSCMENVISLARHGQRKMVGEEKDIMVPVFLNSGRVQSHDRTKNGNPSRIVATSSNLSVEFQGVNGKNPKQNGSLSSSSRQEEQPRRGAVISPLGLSAREVREEIYISKPRKRLDQDVVRGIDNGVDSQLRGENHSGEEDHSSPDEVINDHERCRSRTCTSLQERNGEESDGISETSMVDSISNTDISLDDVVGIIGQKHFWKARRAISNQQRLFAVQVFELHRLIKVQRLIAASPHVLLDNGNYLRKSSPEISPTKKLLPGEYLVKPLPRFAKRKDDSEKDNYPEMECSAENAVGRTMSVSSGKNNPPVAPAGTETQMTATSGAGGSWCFPPQASPGNHHQWLIPVMSPSEGLVYKPYSSPGLVGSGYGGYYGNYIPAPMAVSNFVGGSVYGMPTPWAYHPDPGLPSPGPGYFSPYPVPTVNPFGHPNPPSAATDAQQQSSCNFPSSDKDNTNVVAAKMQMQTQTQPPEAKTQPQKRDSSRVLQGSSGSSPGAKGISGNTRSRLPTGPAADNNNNRGNKRLLTATTAVTMAMPPTMKAAATRVIKVVPHNPKAASESAARIFRSIQAERKQDESSV